MKERSVIETMALTFTRLVAFFLITATLLVCVVEIIDPKTDTTGIVRALTNIVMFILGMVGGIFTKASVGKDLSRRPDE